MPRRNVYIREEDQKLWQLAADMAGEEGMSRLLTEALRAYLRSREGSPMVRLLVTTWNDDDQPVDKAFLGRWLIKDQRSEREGESLESGRQIMAGVEFSVAETKKGAIAVYWVHKDSPEHYHGFLVYESLDDAERDVPADIVAAAAGVLGLERAEFLDI